MLLPQTNLQLYQTMSRRGASGSEMKQVRVAYDISRSLFGDCFRPNHKPFLCHLVGTAGALVMWNQRVEMVIAGMLHSAYLFGRFGDGERGPTSRRRQWLIQQVGNEAEALIWRYSNASWNQPIEQMRNHCVDDEDFCELLTLKFADTLDELSDGGPCYCAEKPMVFGLRDEQAGHESLISVVSGVVCDEAGEQFRMVLRQNQDLAVPPELKTSDRSFHAVTIGIHQLRRGRLQQRVNKLARKLRKAS